MSKPTKPKEEREIDEIRQLLKEEDTDILHEHMDLNQKLGITGVEYREAKERLAEVEATKTCVYCNAPWSPDMEEIYLASGYCESCYDSESKTIIACSSCGKVVYIKEGHDA